MTLRFLRELRALRGEKSFFIKCRRSASGGQRIHNLADRFRIKVHQEYYKTILHRYVTEIFDAVHPRAVLHAGYRLISSSASLFSINRVTEYLKSFGYKIALLDKYRSNSFPRKIILAI